MSRDFLDNDDQVEMYESSLIYHSVYYMINI